MRLSTFINSEVATFHVGYYNSSITEFMSSNRPTSLNIRLQTY